MSRVVVLGAGVIGSAYGALLASAGAEVCMVARGERARHLSDRGLQVDLDGRRIDVACDVVESPAAAAACDVLVVAVRGDQLAHVVTDLAATGVGASTVLVLSNPLGLRGAVADAVGRDRLVWGFSGLGGRIVDGVVQARTVRQQPTVVGMGSPASPRAHALLADTGLPLRQETDMTAWLDTHTVFVAAMASVILRPWPATATGRYRTAWQLVTAMREAFDALENRGIRITPRNLRAIFGRVPTPIAAAYWAHQFTQPMVTVSMAPHARATAATEQPAVRQYALDLVGPDSVSYRRLLDEPW